MERAIISDSTVRTPYLDWITNHLSLFEYTDDYPFKVGEQATYKGHLYESLSNNNLGNNPVDSIHWQILY